MGISGMKESQLQSKIIKDLELSGWYVNKVMKSQKAGWPDLEAFKQSRAIFIETKTTGKTAKPLQQYQHRKLQEQGFQVFVIDTWEQYLQIKYDNL
jgi:hypothetical protein